jgi:sugar lactone lactonase YvrE
MIDVDVALEAGAELGEGPVWDPRIACLYWVDIMRGVVHRFDPESRDDRMYRIGQPVGAVVPTRSGDLLLAMRDGFGRLDLETGAVRMVAAVEGDHPDRRMNDGCCDSAGRFWAGTMAIDECPCAGSLYRLDPDGSVHTMLREVTVSNGIDWSADHRRMYYVDSGTGRVDVFDFDRSLGAIENRRSFVCIPSECGVPDGLTIDSEEFVWVALWGGSAVHRYAPDGSLDAIVRLPVTHPTSCAFGGKDMQDLYVTSATVALSHAERSAQPLAGALFRCRPGAVGRTSHLFGA